MELSIQNSPENLGFSAGRKAAGLIVETIKTKGRAHIILATGASQFETQKQLITEKEIDWSKVVLFHLDEYIGLSDTHPASFRKYIKERFLEKVPPLKAVYLVQGESDAEKECERLGKIIREHPIDLAMIGIGENGHLAFNDPPADFDTDKPFLVVNLDEACRRQQLNEGWFTSLADVPEKAISMSVHQILLSKHIICSVPDRRKAAAVRDCLEKEISNLRPASILRNHQSCFLFLDKQAASLIENNP
ncbi:MAG: glucosamine-6-phosphate deaminase [Bacteroidota bacterium]|nr:glucosamine-6-phosphate deaminase [Bacteroidota bacterium]